MIENGREILPAQDCGIRAEIPSGPFDFLVFSEHNISSTSSSEHKISVGHSSWLVRMLFQASLLRGGRVELKHSEKNSFNAFALSISVITLTPSTFNNGIEEFSRLRYLTACQ